MRWNKKIVPTGNTSSQHNVCYPGKWRKEHGLKIKRLIFSDHCFLSVWFAVWHWIWNSLSGTPLCSFKLRGLKCSSDLLSPPLSFPFYFPFFLPSLPLFPFSSSPFPSSPFHSLIFLLIFLFQVVEIPFLPVNELSSTWPISETWRWSCSFDGLPLAFRSVLVAN